MPLCQPWTGQGRYKTSLIFLSVSLSFACKAWVSLYYIMKTCDLKTNTGGKKTSGIPWECNAFLRRSMLSFMWDDEAVLCDSCAEKLILLQHEAVRIWPRLTLSQQSESWLYFCFHRFLTKAGLRRLLTADEVWTLGRKRSLGEHNIPTEQEILQTAGSKDSSDPKCFSAYSHRSKPCHNTSTERKVKREDGKTSRKQESLKANSKPHGYGGSGLKDPFKM